MNIYLKIAIFFCVLFAFFGLSYLFLVKISQKKQIESQKTKVDIKRDFYENLPKYENNNYQENITPKIYTNIPPPHEFPTYVERDYIISRPLYRRPRRRAIFKALAQTKDEIKKDFRTYSKLK